MDAPAVKWSCSSHWLIALLAGYFTIVLNCALWRYAWNNIEIDGFASGLFAASMPLVLFLALHLLFNFACWPWIGKPLIAFLLVVSSGAAYYMFEFGVFIDPGLIRGVLEATPREAGEIITLRSALWVLCLGAIPAAAVVAVRVSYRPASREILGRLAAAGAALALLGLLGLFFYKDYVIVGRNHKDVVGLVNPANYLSAGVRHFRRVARARQPLVKIDEDASHKPFDDPYKTVLVLIVGESARSMNFSLNGYPRQTNPRLAGEDVVSFKEVVAGGTYTAYSLPFLFSSLGRREFDLNRAPSQENLVDLAQQCGYRVLWRDNNTGGKGVNTRVPTEDFFRGGQGPLWNGDSYYDEILLVGLEDWLRRLDSDAFIVLHMIGSHGPSYHRRYPPAFKRFVPACETANIQNAPREEIVNTYDNTILYTDHVIAEAIAILKKFPELEAGLIYVSDHGQSLGENGIYLHGLPYALAPEEQKRVPMVLWMSETMKREDHIDFEGLRKSMERQPLSHDHVFHSVLGLLEIKSKHYNPALDIFANHRTESLPE